jgi:fatty acid desaturase
MPDKTPENDLREIWRSQSTEPMEMKLGSHRLRQRAKDLRSKSRRELLNSIVFAVLIAAGSVYGCIWTDYPVARALFAVTAAWVLIGQFFLHRTKRQASPPEDAGLRTSLDSCRRELERHIRFDRGAFLWLQGPLFLAFGTLVGMLVFAVGGKGLLVKMAAPCLALLVVWALCMVVFRRNQQREFRRAIEELDQIERER